MKARLLLVHALSPLHAGTGRGIGVIDLPIAREKATGLPFLPGSSIKGTLRDACEDSAHKADCTKVFGPDTQNAADHAGAAQFADARLLLLPVRSLAGTFAWVTSPYVLRRFARDARETGLTDVPGTVPEPPAPKAGATAETCLVVTSECKIQLANQKLVVLEDLDLTAGSDAATDAWAQWLGQRLFPGQDAEAQKWQQLLRERLCIVRDDVLTFLLNTALEITARVKLMDESKTVQEGGLWYEEALPVETILAGLVVASPVKKSDIGSDAVFTVILGLTDKTLQFGGKATVGRGLCRTVLVSEEAGDGHA